MKIIEKIKNAIFEDDELEENEVVEEPKKEIKPVFDNEVVKKIDIEKTIPKRIDLPRDNVSEEKPVFPKREHRITPVIFDDDDFIMEDESPINVNTNKEVYKEPYKEEVKKPLYSGYKDERQKEKFKPSPIISPVYGFVGVSPILEQPRNDELSSFNEMFAKEKKETVTLDAVRQKAYGVAPVDKVEEDDDLGLLYDMQQDDAPAISKITLGDAEEYFDDLGLEYNVDYRDHAKESSTIDNKKHTVEEKKGNVLESTAELEITKEQMRPKTAKEIKKVTKIKDLDIDDINESDDMSEPDEKNLYDLIDMMYDSKE